MSFWTYVYSNENGILQTKLYSKPSDTHCYLVPSSCHRTHIVENIPYNTARRVLINNSETQNYTGDKEVYSGHLVARGYNPEFVREAFEKAEKLDRSSLYAVREDKENKLCLPLVVDTNPALPNMTKIINQYKYILNLDSKLSKVIPSSSIFVSHRSAKTLKDLLISSKIPNNPNNSSSIVPNNTNNIADPNNMMISNSSSDSKSTDSNGIKSCNKCYLCRNYLQVCDHFTSFHTEQMFKHKSMLGCDTECIIYMCECISHKVSYTGYTITNMKTRFSNNKSHIKNKNASCEFVKHFITTEHKDIDFSSRKNYDQSLSKHIRIIILEKVDVDIGASREQKEAKCEEREGYWQTQLKTLQTYGGLNVRDNRKYVSRRTQEKNS